MRRGSIAMPSLDPVDRDLGVPRQQLVHQALEVGREVLHHDERQAGIQRDLVEEPFDRLQPPAEAPIPTT